MKKLAIFSLFFIVSMFDNGYSQSVVGKWKTIDDDTGEAKSVVEIYENNGKIYGKVVQILDKSKEGKLCDKCEGSKKNKPVKGLVIIEGLKKNDSAWDGGTILDPTKGKEYKCSITLDGKNKLKVRGYVGFSLLGRTQYWTRAEE